MTDNKKAVDLLAGQILNIVDAYIKKTQTQYIFTVISKVKGDNCYVNINGVDAIVPNGTSIHFSPYDSVIVCIPNGDYKKKFILAQYKKQA